MHCVRNYQISVILGLLICAFLTGCQSPIADAFNDWRYRGLSSRLDPQPRPVAGSQDLDSPSNSSSDKLTRAIAAEGNGQHDEAFRMYLAVLHQDPNNAVANHRAGVLYDMQRDYGSAERHYLQALRFNPADANLLSDIGYSYVEQGRYVDAQRYLAQALQYDPNHRQSMYNLALLYAKQGDTQQAVAMFRRAGDSESDIQEKMALLFPGNSGQSPTTNLASRSRSVPTNNDSARSALPAPERNPDFPEIDPDLGTVGSFDAEAGSVAENTSDPTLNNADYIPGVVLGPPDRKPMIVSEAPVANYEASGRYEELAPAPMPGDLDSDSGSSVESISSRTGNDLPLIAGERPTGSNNSALGSRAPWQDMPTVSNSLAENGIGGPGPVTPASNAEIGLILDDEPVGGGGGLSPNPFGSPGPVADPRSVGGSAKAAAFLGMEAGVSMFALETEGRPTRQEPPPRFPGPGISYEGNGEASFPNAIETNINGTGRLPMTNDNSSTAPQIDSRRVSPSINSRSIPRSAVSNMSARGNIGSSFQTNGEFSNSNGLREAGAKLEQHNREIEQLRRRLQEQRREAEARARSGNAGTGGSTNSNALSNTSTTNGASATAPPMLNPATLNTSNRFARESVPSSQRPW
ncbi:MAG: hypothetical protein CMJ78_27835 [Planctomycetaceae bacterium]|nr:hypothetical protein [Planctomycetaceae bacterium]